MLTRGISFVMGEVGDWQNLSRNIRTQRQKARVAPMKAEADASSKYCFSVFVTSEPMMVIWLPEPLPFYCGKRPCAEWTCAFKGQKWMARVEIALPFWAQETEYTELLGAKLYKFRWIYGILLWQMILDMDVAASPAHLDIKVWISYDQKLQRKTFKGW